MLPFYNVSTVRREGEGRRSEKRGRKTLCSTDRRRVGKVRLTKPLAYPQMSLVLSELMSTADTAP